MGGDKVQRRWANFSLAIALALFLIAIGFRHLAVAGYVETAALASLAGGIADWFAVTALFRHPLGLTWLPHTSIIAKNRDRIIEAIAVMVEKELLSVDFIVANIERLDVVSQLILWLKSPLSETAAESAASVLREAANWVDAEELARSLGSWVQTEADAWSLSDVGIALVKWMVHSENDRALFQFLSQQAVHVLNTIEFTDDMEARLKALLDNYSRTTTQKLLLGVLESLGTLDYKDLSDTVRSHLVSWIESDKAFQQFELVLVRIMMALRDDAAIREKVEGAKRGFLAEVPWSRIVTLGLEQVRRIAEEGRAGAWMTQLAHQAADSLEHDPSRREQVQRWIKDGAVALLRRYHPLVGRLVRDNLSQMNERDWIDKLEWYVGRDLQWIRINGAIVGGIVGLALYLLVQGVWGAGF